MLSPEEQIITESDSRVFTNILALNYFELFEIPVGFNLDITDLKQKYTRLQQAVHPDRFAKASSQEKRLSMQQTSHVNEAFHTLKEPVARAVYLLKLKGMDINLENETTMDMDFLMEQMAIREAMAEAGEDESALEKLDRLGKDIRGKIEHMTAEFSDNYEQDKLDASRELVRKLQFLHKARHEVSDLTALIEDRLL